VGEKRREQNGNNISRKNHVGKYREEGRLQERSRGRRTKGGLKRKMKPLPDFSGLAIEVILDNSIVRLRGNIAHPRQSKNQ